MFAEWIFHDEFSWLYNTTAIYIMSTKPIKYVCNGTDYSIPLLLVIDTMLCDPYKPFWAIRNLLPPKDQVDENVIRVIKVGLWGIQKATAEVSEFVEKVFFLFVTSSSIIKKNIQLNDRIQLHYLKCHFPAIFMYTWHTFKLMCEQFYQIKPIDPIRS